MKLIKTTDVMQMLSVSRSTVERLVKDGTLKAYKIGRLVRFDEDEVKEIIR